MESEDERKILDQSYCWIKALLVSIQKLPKLFIDLLKNIDPNEKKYKSFFDFLTNGFFENYADDNKICFNTLKFIFTLIEVSKYSELNHNFYQRLVD